MSFFIWHIELSMSNIYLISHLYFHLPVEFLIHVWISLALVFAFPCLSSILTVSYLNTALSIYILTLMYCVSIMGCYCLPCSCFLYLSVFRHLMETYWFTPTRALFFEICLSGLLPCLVFQWIFKDLCWVEPASSGQVHRWGKSPERHHADAKP